MSRRVESTTAYLHATGPVCSKTTLMDVIAMRKDHGTITGDIVLNGFPQERRSFLRVSGYVEVRTV